MIRFLALLIFAVVLGSAARAQNLSYPGLELTLVDLGGDKQLVGLVPGTVFAPRLSPDGQRVALDIVAGPNEASASRSIWIAELANVNDRYQLPLVDGDWNYGPAWTPDGQRIVFLASSEAGDKLYWRRADGQGDAEHLIDARAPESWLADGPTLTYLTLTGVRDYGIALLNLATRETEPLLDYPGTEEHSSNVSRDGRFIVYVSNSSGDYQVYVESLPSTGEPMQLTTAGGAHPIWSPDGRAIYFDNAGALYRIRFDPAAGQPVGSPEALPIEGFVQGPLRRQFDISPDGSRFLMLFPQSD